MRSPACGYGQTGGIGHTTGRIVGAGNVGMGYGLAATQGGRISVTDILEKDGVLFIDESNIDNSDEPYKPYDPEDTKRFHITDEMFELIGNARELPSIEKLRLLSEAFAKNQPKLKFEFSDDPRVMQAILARKVGYIVPAAMEGTINKDNVAGLKVQHGIIGAGNRPVTTAAHDYLYENKPWIFDGLDYIINGGGADCSAQIEFQGVLDVIEGRSSDMPSDEQAMAYLKLSTRSLMRRLHRACEEVHSDSRVAGSALFIATFMPGILDDWAYPTAPSTTYELAQSQLLSH